jgi:ubiquinone biosynthesis protein COQ4
MVAALGETTAGPALPRLRDHMLASEEGRRILKERPRVNSSTVDMAALARLPEGTFGKAYVTWLERCGVTPDTRTPVCISSTLPMVIFLMRFLPYRCTMWTTQNWHT